MKIIKVKVNEPELITDEKEIWYCNEVLPLKVEISELEGKNEFLKRRVAKAINSLEDLRKFVRNESDYNVGAAEVISDITTIINDLKGSDK